VIEQLLHPIFYIKKQGESPMPLKTGDVITFGWTFLVTAAFIMSPHMNKEGLSFKDC
jgi:hypothetical protein